LTLPPCQLEKLPFSLDQVLAIVRGHARRQGGKALSFQQRCHKAIDAVRLPSTERTLGLREAARRIGISHTALWQAHRKKGPDGKPQIGAVGPDGKPRFSEVECDRKQAATSLAHLKHPLDFSLDTR
jgi:hypothetical protein